MRKTSIALGLLAAMAAGQATAQEFNTDALYFGGGLSNNSLDPFDDATGYQFFGGYPLDFKLGEASTAVEVGYMDSGDFEYTSQYFGTVSAGSVSGLWATGVADFALSPKLSAIGRAGLDFGDDDGVMFGIGAGYDVNEQIEVRGEYVIRDNVDSLQANIVYRP